MLPNPVLWVCVILAHAKRPCASQQRRTANRGNMIQFRATKIQRAFTFSCVFVSPLIFLAFFVIAWCSDQQTPWYIWGIFLAGPALIVYSYGYVATEVSIKDGQIKLSSLFAKKSINITDIDRIDVRPWNRGFIIIRTSNTRFFMYRNIPGAIEAMKNIARGNPAIKLKK